MGPPGKTPRVTGPGKQDLVFIVEINFFIVIPAKADPVCIMKINFRAVIPAKADPVCIMKINFRAVIPAKAGIQSGVTSPGSACWIPAFAGMTEHGGLRG